ncbi:hypothetical protein ACFVYP_39875 [Kitasatospora sp. NPDC058201]|uniref:hypothetical protein n=1 Tax=unclassified Kitasatospora TaxID=2633591 RepID=UPI0036510B16
MSENAAVSSAELTAILIINLFDSRCGHCRRPVLPNATHHTDVSGYNTRKGGGCGARFTTTATEYRQRVTTDRLREMRPDLPTAATPEA